MKKAMFIDLDGTLLSEDQKISQLNKDAIKEAKESGWSIILSTGKSFENAKKHYKELELKDWFITSQGQVIKKPNSDELIENFMDQKDILEIFKDNKPHRAVIETTTGVYSTNPEDNSIAQFLNSKPTLFTGQKIHGIIGLYIRADKDVFYEHPKFDVFKWDTGSGYKVLSFKPKGINKLFALNLIKQEEKYDKVVVFGNGRNDLKPLQVADLGIAMCNSQRRVLEAIENKSEFDNQNSGVGIEIRKILNGTYKL